MSRRIGPVVRAGPYAAVCTYWPLSRAQWLWWPRREQLPPLLALGWRVGTRRSSQLPPSLSFDGCSLQVVGVAVTAVTSQKQPALRVFLFIAYVCVDMWV